MKVGDLVKFSGYTTKGVRLGVVTSMRLMNPDDTRDYLCRVSGFDYEIWDHELEVANEANSTSYKGSQRGNANTFVEVSSRHRCLYRER